MEQQALNKDKFSFIVYEGSNSPRYYEMKKAFFRVLVFGLPIITVISIIITLSLIIYFKEIRAQAMRKEPAIINSLKHENFKLQTEVNKVTLLNKELENKLTSTDIGNSLDKLSFLKTPAGQLDKTSPAIFNIEETQVLSDKNNVVLKFNLVNSTKDGSRVYGYLHVFARINGHYVHYPNLDSETDQFSIQFNEGESFATSRFRPVKANFTTPNSKGTAIFQVLVFSRTGDLLHKQIIAQKL